MLIPLGFWAASGGGAAAGSFDLLETQVLTSSAASVTFSSLSTYAADYQHLQIRMLTRSSQSVAASGSTGIRFNSVGSGQYSSHILKGTGSSVLSEAFTSQDYMFSYLTYGSSATANAFGPWVIDILDPFETSKNTTIRSIGGLPEIRLMSGAWINTSAVTSIEIDMRDGHSFVTGSRFSLYGLRKAA